MRPDSDDALDGACSEIRAALPLFAGRDLDPDEHEAVQRHLDDCPAADTVLNEPVPELGLGPRTYAGFKLRFLNVVVASEFAALGVVETDDPDAVLLQVPVPRGHGRFDLQAIRHWLELFWIYLNLKERFSK